MASMNCHYYSFCLKHTVDINVIIPTPEGNEQITSTSSKEAYPYEEGLPVLYLLHGAFGDYSSWMRFSNIERYAQKHRCAVVMASAENSLYQDMYQGNKFFTFFTEELPELVKSLYPVSKKREDTYIAGLSMGGYGAWFLGLSKPEQYSKAASLSGAVNIAETYEGIKSETIDGPFPWNAVFQDPEKLAGSDADLMVLYDRCVKEGVVPDLYQACGTEDFLYEMNVKVRDKMKEKGANITYIEGKGGHNWDFWDKYIQDVLQWMLPV
ncbi:alpha/beta hydrolase family protein [Clostridium sp. E02]|uniref:alpha/beta hydrolase n=1 Tax=Clostridium sp. E02 TaxID=2487134 RepID=UPI000F533640|nr:alpha/beta hydrolase family protein [Clostridium sp. E02]